MQKNKGNRLCCLNNYFTRRTLSVSNRKTHRKAQHTLKTPKQTPVDWITHLSLVDTNTVTVLLPQGDRTTACKKICVCVPGTYLCLPAIFPLYFLNYYHFFHQYLRIVLPDLHTQKDVWHTYLPCVVERWHNFLLHILYTLL